MLKAVVFVFVGAFAIFLGYPLAAAVSHGLNPATWPTGVLTPVEWITGFLASYAVPNVNAVLEMVKGHSPAFAGGGIAQIAAIFAVPIALMMMLPSPRRGPRRDPDALQGDARWATKRERARMSRGIEFGIDRETGKTIRVAVEGNLLSIAPPRKGKTSGHIIPHLIAADKGAWSGPAVVIDPKGSAYRAVAERRRLLKKTVRCLDPMNLCGGVDLWNPLAGIVPTDTAYLQRVARTLLPSAISEENAYFQNKAVEVIWGACLGAHFLGNATPLAVSNLLANPERLTESLKKVTGTVADRVREFLAMDAKTRDPIL